MDIESNKVYNVDINLTLIQRAVSHATNITSIDNDLNTPDFELGKKLGQHVLDYIRGKTDCQILDRMSDMDKLLIGNPEHEQYLKDKYHY